MIKPDRLRNQLTKVIDYFKSNPDALILQYDNGRIKATGGKSHSFEYHYDLEIIVQDFKYHPDVLFVPVLEFVRTEQSELLHNPTNQEKITFEIDTLNNKTYDIYIKIPLTERVVVKEENGLITANHANEPQPTEWEPFDLERVRIYLGDSELVYDSAEKQRE
ncbi:phage tail protein [Pasteurellaceae bacterium LFhippo2]|nr:phage tail protein [Pasteurellaceae bacterium LFhippo2]